MDWTTYLANALVAAALGAGTNELAIITILRYILPRKKGEIARRIRHLVSSDLMSPAKMREKLDEPQVLRLLASHIDSALAEWLARNMPAPAALLGPHDADADRLAARLRDILLDEFQARAGSADFAAATLAPFLRDRYRALQRRTPGSFLKNPAEAMAEAAADWLRGLENADALRERVRLALDQWLAERVANADTLGELLPSGISRSLRRLAGDQAPAVVEQLARLLGDDAVQAAATRAVMTAISEQLRGQGLLGDIKGLVVNAMRVERDVRGVCARLPATLRRNLARPERMAEMAAALGRAVDHKLDQPLDDDYRTLETRVRLVNAIMATVWKSSTFATAAAALRQVVQSALARSIQENLERAGVDDLPDAVFAEAAERLRRLAASPASRALLAGQLDDLYRGWKSRPLGRPERYVDPALRGRLAAALADEVREALRLRLADFAEESGIWDIVVSSIEGYDDKQLADLIHKLARSELRWVTVLGGVIGFAVGLVHTAVLAALGRGG